jgi:hypothetical protein
MQPESSDGLASVGTILPEGTVAAISGGRFPFLIESRNQFAGLTLRLSLLPVKLRMGSCGIQADVAQLVEQLIRNQ